MSGLDPKQERVLRAARVLDFWYWHMDALHIQQGPQEWQATMAACRELHAALNDLDGLPENAYRFTNPAYLLSLGPDILEWAALDPEEIETDAEVAGDTPSEVVEA